MTLLTCGVCVSVFLELGEPVIISIITLFVNYRS